MNDGLKDSEPSAPWLHWPHALWRGGQPVRSTLVCVSFCVGLRLCVFRSALLPGQPINVADFGFVPVGGRV
jgi:hypothetical protein